MQFNCKVAAFVEGVNTLVPGELLTLWDEGELELLLCGIRNKILLLTHNVELRLEIWPILCFDRLWATCYTRSMDLQMRDPFCSKKKTLLFVNLYKVQYFFWHRQYNLDLLKANHQIVGMRTIRWVYWTDARRHHLKWFTWKVLKLFSETVSPML